MAIPIDDLRQNTAVSTDAYTIDGTDYWSDEQLTALLTQHVLKHVNDPVVAVTEDEDGKLVNGSIQSPGQLDVESVTLYDDEGDELDVTEITQAGFVTFAADQSSDAPITWSGLAYDMHAAAAAVLNAWAAAVAPAYDVEMDGQALKRSQMAAGLRKQAEQHAEQGEAGGIQSIPTTARF